MAEDDLSGMLDALAKEFPSDDTFEPVRSLKQILLIMEALEADISPIIGMRGAQQSGVQPRTLEMDCAVLSAVQRRTLVRAVFAMIEGITYRIKQTALELDDVLDRRLTVTERMAINEQTGRVDDSEQVKVRKESPTLGGSVRFAFNMLEKVTCSEFELDVGEVGWGAFKESISVRDRITHPKQASDLEVKNAEIASLITAHIWFLRSLVTAMMLAIRALPSGASDKRSGSN